MRHRSQDRPALTVAIHTLPVAAPAMRNRRSVRTDRLRQARPSWAVALLALTAALFTSTASAQTLGMVASDGTDRVTVFCRETTDIIFRSEIDALVMSTFTCLV